MMRPGALRAGLFLAHFDGRERLLFIFGVFHAVRGIHRDVDLPGFGLRNGDVPVRPGAVKRLADAACQTESGGNIL